MMMMMMMFLLSQTNQKIHLQSRRHQGLTESSQSFDKEVQDFMDFMQPGGDDRGFGSRKQTKRHCAEAALPKRFQRIALVLLLH